MPFENRLRKIRESELQSEENKKKQNQLEKEQEEERRKEQKDKDEQLIDFTNSKLKPILEDVKQNYTGGEGAIMIGEATDKWVGHMSFWSEKLIKFRGVEISLLWGYFERDIGGVDAERGWSRGISIILLENGEIIVSGKKSGENWKKQLFSINSRGWKSKVENRISYIIEKKDY